MRIIKAFIFVGFFICITSHFIAIAATDAPHNASNNISCGSCHGETLVRKSPFWGTGTYDQLCLSCHRRPSGCPSYSQTDAPAVTTHSDSSGSALAECRNCHNPHYQRQKIYKNTDANNLYLATGTISLCSYNAGSEESTLTYSTITYKTTTEWNAAKLIGKTETCRHTILFPNVNKLGYNYPIIGVNEGVYTITVKGNACAFPPPTTFAVIYGQYIKDTIVVDGTNKTVKFFDQTGAKSFADGDTTYNGVCEVCHTLTDHFSNNGGAPDQNHANVGGAGGTNCITCHRHVDGFGHGAGTEAGCEDCHGKDGGAGTTVSHSTHMENDADDLKGPHITCGDCHDTNNYPLFRDGKDLSQTTVCDTCHSPSGSYNGVVSVSGSIGAKDNWSNGVYSGSALATGKEKWCAGCHDDTPAYSKGQYIEIIIDNTDTNFTTGGTGWNTSTSTLQYGTNYRYHSAGTGTNTAIWTPNIPQAGEYSIYAWWVDSTNRATNAPYTINYNGGSETVTVNQETMGGTWNYLGTYTFSAGTSGSVVLSDNANGLVVADAIKFESGVQATYAPNVIGDNSTYGFYATGHKINCLSCHDSEKRHIDGEHRTYEIDETPDPDVVINPYCDSYRLRYIDGEPSMVVPRVAVAGQALNNWKDFALCFDCHNRFEVIGDTGDDVSGTNFWNDDTSDTNSHSLHLAMDNRADTDFDNTTLDSGVTCITCHNVHGAIRGPMIRHGELISPPGTTRYVPSFDFYYYVPGDGLGTATFTPTLAGGTYDIYAWWSEAWNRAQYTKYLINYDSGQSEVIVNQKENGGQWNLLGQFTITTASGAVTLTSDGADQYIFADAIRWYRTDGSDEVIVDDQNAIYTGTWTDFLDARYGTSYRYHSAVAGTDSATWTPNIPSTGTYSVYAWWHANTDRATDAPYTINFDGGSASVTKDQQQNGGAWNLLGTYSFVAGTSGNVQLGITATGIVVADAIGWDSDGTFSNDWNGDGVSDPEIVLDDTNASYAGAWTYSTTNRYGSSTKYYFAPIKDPGATANQSVGGIMQSYGHTSNHSCRT